MHISTLSQLLAMLALSATVLSAPTPIAASADDGHPGGPRAAAACQVPRLQLDPQDPDEKKPHVAQRVWDACRYETLGVMLKSGLKSEKPRPGYTAWLEHKDEQRAKKAEEQWRKEAERKFEVMRISNEKSKKKETERLKKHSQLVGSLHEQNFVQGRYGLISISLTQTPGNLMLEISPHRKSTSFKTVQSVFEGQFKPDRIPKLVSILPVSSPLPLDRMCVGPFKPLYTYLVYSATLTFAAGFLTTRKSCIAGKALCSQSKDICD
ncbi:hypothetical protein M9X92_007337 [Pyricularia oryzae]|nr:hypothetical protein M9X92_007337 [Pyricularia oryzae]